MALRYSICQGDKEEGAESKGYRLSYFADR